MIPLPGAAISTWRHKSYFNPFEMHELLIEVALTFWSQTFWSQIALNDSPDKMHQSGLKFRDHGII